MENINTDEINGKLQVVRSILPGYFENEQSGSQRERDSLSQPKAPDHGKRRVERAQAAQQAGTGAKW